MEGQLLTNEQIAEIYAEHFKEIDAILKEVNRHNNRILRAVSRTLGKAFRRTVVVIAKEMEACPYYKWQLVRKPVGDLIWCEHRPIQVHVDQRAVGDSGDSWVGEIYIQLKERLWLKFHYSC